MDHISRHETLRQIQHFFKNYLDSSSPIPVCKSKGSGKKENLLVDKKKVGDLSPFVRLLEKVNQDDSLGFNLTQFIHNLGLVDSGEFCEDVLGRSYEENLSPSVRHKLGQYFTPPQVIDLICHLTITKPSDQVLDPACGSGRFLIGAYNRLKGLNTRQQPTADPLDRLFGVEINPFPALMAATNLVLLASPLGRLNFNTNVLLGDFFGGGLGGMPIFFDAIISNPPFIRQENISDKDKVRLHLSQAEASKISSKSDLYVYFLTKSTKMLKQGGRLSFLCSERWLYVDYGSGLQQFLLENYRIEAVIFFDRHVFRDALIETVILSVTKEEDADARDCNVTRFLRVKKMVPVQTIAQALESPPPSVAGQLVDLGPLELVVVDQRKLQQTKKWRTFTHAPPFYFELIKQEFVPLKSIATITNGLRTGANKFFYLTGAQLSEWAIPLSCARALLKSVGQSDYIQFKTEDTEWYVLDFHPIVEEVKNSDPTSQLNLTTRVTNFLRDNQDSFGGLYQWVVEGEEFFRGKNIPSHDVWYSLGQLGTSPIVFTKEIWKKNLVYYNPDGIVLDQHLYKVVPHDRNETMLLLAILNSEVTGIFRDLHGRVASGQALSRVENTVGEVKELPVIDYRQFTEEDRRRIIEAFRLLLGKERELIPQKTKSATHYSINEEYSRLREEFNVAILQAMGFSRDTFQLLLDTWNHLIEFREKIGGVNKSILVEDRE